jgi:dihydrofolate synthase/folylpolyglutamate synthase
MTSYYEALRTIFERTDLERGERPPYADRVWRLDRVHELLAQLGDPHRQYPSVHIAGTKGKGSTTALIESILRAAGYRTGMYTSPHLHTFRERMCLNGAPIPEDEVIRLMDRLRPMLAERPELTVFEIITALAMLYFAECGVDWGIFEVGLGGRLDATNVLSPEVTTITSVSMDHIKVLGDTLGAIAREKAGIIKPDTPVVSAPQMPEAAKEIKRVAAEHNAPLTWVGRDWRWTRRAADAHGQRFELDGSPSWLCYPDLSLPLLGRHQLENAAVAVATIEVLHQNVVNIPTQAIRDGLRAVQWPGRLEVLSANPLLVVDGAHNHYSMETMLGTLGDYLDFGRLMVVFGASQSHLPDQLLQALRPHAQRLFLTQANHPKATPLDALQELADAMGFSATIHASVETALGAALAEAAPGDLVLATGSLFVVAEAREAWYRLNGLPPLPSDPPGAY